MGSRLHVSRFVDHFWTIFSIRGLHLSWLRLWLLSGAMPLTAGGSQSAVCCRSISTATDVFVPRSHRVRRSLSCAFCRLQLQLVLSAAESSVKPLPLVSVVSDFLLQTSRVWLQHC